jgi:hypothetical protein
MRNTPQASSNGGGRLPARPPLVIGCGALANELVELTRRAGLPPMDLTCLPASLHNRPERIPSAVQARIRRARADGYDRIFVAYADCGTGGMLDKVLDVEGIARLEGAHCYEVYAGRAAFAALHDAEPGTFYLTDYLVRNFERLVVRGLGLDRHPELLPVYFGNYRRLVYLAQSDDAALTELAAAAAARLGNLAFERRLVGLGELSGAIASFAPRATDRLASNAMLELRKRGTGIVSPQLEGLAVERGHGGDAGLAAGLTGARPLRESGRRGSRSARTRPTSAGTRFTGAGTRPTCAETLHPMHVARGGGRGRRSPEAAAVSEAAA